MALISPMRRKNEGMTIGGVDEGGSPRIYAGEGALQRSREKVEFQSCALTLA